MSLRDAAQQALDALKIAQDDCIHGEMAEASPIFQNAITALQAALVGPQPEIEQLKAERDALKAAAEKGTEYVLAHINQGLRAERDALLADAERYRWLRDGGFARLPYDDHGMGPEFDFSDAAIDAARSEK